MEDTVEMFIGLVKVCILAKMSHKQETPIKRLVRLFTLLVVIQPLWSKISDSPLF